MKKYYSKIIKYIPFQEAFKAGSNAKVMKLMGKLLYKKAGVVLDADIPEGYQNNLGKFRSYTGYLKDESEIRINFLLTESDKIHSVNFFKPNKDKPYETVVFKENTNIVSVINTILDVLSGNFVEMDESDFEEVDGRLLEKKKGSIGDQRTKAVLDWILEPAFAKERQKLITTVDLKKIFRGFVREVNVEDFDNPKVYPTEGQFSKIIREYLKSNGMTNPNVKFRVARRKKVSIDIPMPLPEDKPLVAELKAPMKMMFSWKDSFDDLEDNFEEMMENPDSMPFGQLVFGNGGTGKSFYYNQQKDRFKLQFIKGAPNTARLIKYLYDYRDMDAIVFDDADSVVTTNNSANILKMATDDTVAERVIYLPKGSGKDLAGIEPDVYDENGVLLQAFKFNSSIVVITNLPKIKDQALRTRLYQEPIFMTKEDIIEKIEATSVPAEMGATKEMGRDVSEFLLSLVGSGDFDIKNEQLSYRFFKIALKYIKRYPTKWKGKTMRGLKIGVRTSIKDESTKLRVYKSKFSEEG